MIKIKKKTNLKHVQDRLDILEQNIETLNNNILNLEICFNIHKHGLNIYGQERLTDKINIFVFNENDEYKTHDVYFSYE